MASNKIPKARRRSRIRVHLKGQHYDCSLRLSSGIVISVAMSVVLGFFMTSTPLLGPMSTAFVSASITTIAEQTETPRSTTMQESKTPYQIKFENPNYKRGHKSLTPYILSSNMTVGKLVHPKELMDEDVFQAYSSITKFFEGGKDDETHETKREDQGSSQSNNNDNDKAKNNEASSSEDAKNDNTNESNNEIKDALKLLHGQDPNMATMTLRGYKGGPMANQINQDRAVIVSPYIWWSNDDDIAEINKNPQEGEEDEDVVDDDDDEMQDSLNEKRERRHHVTPKGHEKDFLLGVFDGHGTGGEVISDFVAKNLPKLLAYKIREYQKTESMTTNQSDAGEEEETLPYINKSDDTFIFPIEVISTMLHETFLELDETAPPSEALSGGCTASVALKFGPHLFVANAGDSRIIVGYSKTTTSTSTSKAPESQDEDAGGQQEGSISRVNSIQYVTREDKPHLEEERRRVEALKGEVYIPKDPSGTSRVMRVNRSTGQRYGLAMSRSIGDWGVGQFGVIPDPLIEVMSLSQYQSSSNRGRGSGCNPMTSLDENGQQQITMSCSSNNDNPQDGTSYIADEAFFFVVGATDGLFDFVTPQTVVDVVGDMFSSTGDIVGDNQKASQTLEKEQEQQQAPQQKQLHPITTCGYLVGEAVHGWNAKHGGRYRDDIAIAVHKVII